MKRISQAILLITLLAVPVIARAHQLDEYLQATLVSIDPDEIRLQINLTPGVAVAEKVLGLIDQNHDGVVSTNESAAYGEALKRDLGVGLDGHSLPLQIAATTFPEPAELRTGWGIIQMEYVAALDNLATGPHKLSLENRHLPAVSVYLFNAAQPKSPRIRITEQKRNEIQSREDISFHFEPPKKSVLAEAILVFILMLAATVGAGVMLVRPKKKSGAEG